MDNLIRNAIAYTSSGGAVTIHLARQDGPSGDSWVMDVSDTGCGIDAQHHEAVFRRFFRVDKSRSRDQGGTGLGLALVKHIVQAHHGHIELTSQLHTGTTFSLYLPVA